METKGDTKQKAKQEAELKEKQEAELKAKQEAELKAKSKEHLKLMNTLNVDVLYINNKGELFTQKNLAELSTSNKKQIKELTREILELKAK